MSMRSRPAQASIAAEPVSPEVAPTMVTRASRAASTWSNRRPRSCSAMSLNDERRAVEQLLHEQAGVELDQRHHGGMAEAGIGVAAQRGERGERDRVADERLDHTRGQRVVRQAAHRAPVGRGEVGPGLRHVQPAILGQTGQQHAGEVADRSLAAGGDVAHGSSVEHGTSPTLPRSRERPSPAQRVEGVATALRHREMQPAIAVGDITLDLRPGLPAHQRDALRATGDRPIGRDRRIDQVTRPSGTGTRCRSPRCRTRPGCGQARLSA